MQQKRHSEMGLERHGGANVQGTTSVSHLVFDAATTAMATGTQSAPLLPL